MGFLDDYEPVEDRLREFWHDHPEGRIETVLEAYSAENGYIVKALVWREDLGDIGLGKVEVSRPSATGYAQEHVTERGVNATSALENCETSAIGRALANLGYAPKGKRPSREEMSKVRPGEEVGRGDSSDAAPSSRAQGTASDRSGEGHSVREPSPEHHYPVDPAVCAKNDHKNNRGQQHWGSTIPPDFVERCLMCGMPKISAMESTTADLGPA